ncbi:MAG: M28 family peptidase [Gemmatimonadetes bacterium]|nr:M28 family peptidase [Gemmatimonadota bacterium]
MRILRALGIRSRRTIRIALWCGEEQGLLGSCVWARNHEDDHCACLNPTAMFLRP